MIQIDAVIDSFVEKFNKRDHEYLDPQDVPERLRRGAPNEAGQYRWIILKEDGLKWLGPVISKLPKRFPPSYHSWVTRYSFPAFEAKELFFFGNTGQEYYWELSKKIFADKQIVLPLFREGYLQIGSPTEYNSDPICFDTKRSDSNDLECPLVQLDSEEILNHGRIRVVKEIAPSFLSLAKELLE